MENESGPSSAGLQPFPYYTASQYQAPSEFERTPCPTTSQYQAPSESQQTPDHVADQDQAFSEQKRIPTMKITPPTPILDQRVLSHSAPQNTQNSADPHEQNVRVYQAADGVQQRNSEPNPYMKPGERDYLTQSQRNLRDQILKESWIREYRSSNPIQVWPDPYVLDEVPAHREEYEILLHDFVSVIHIIRDMHRALANREPQPWYSRRWQKTIDDPIKSQKAYWDIRKRMGEICTDRRHGFVLAPILAFTKPTEEFPRTRGRDFAANITADWEKHLPKKWYNRIFK